MSQENVELVRRAIAPVNERDIDAYLGCCTDDVQLVSFDRDEALKAAGLSA